MDARIEIDRILSAYFKYHRDAEYSDLHEDYAIVYVKGKQRSWGYGPDSDVMQITSKVIKEVEHELELINAPMQDD